MIFDSCTHIRNLNLKTFKILNEKLKKNKISKALCILDSDIRDYDIKKFHEICLKFDRFVPVIELKNTKSITLDLKLINNLGIKFIKIHPRNLKTPIKKENVYLNLLNKVNKYNFITLWCTFDGWSEKNLSEIDQLNLLSKIINKNNKKKFILMHAGGPNTLKYYERFRFNNNVFFDLSYTSTHYSGTSVENDLIFLFKKFDKRLIYGTDFPTLNFKKSLFIFKKMIAKSKISKIKKINIKYKNLKNLTNG